MISGKCAGVKKKSANVTTQTRSGRESKMPGKYADYVWRRQHATSAALLPPSVILLRFQPQAPWPDIPSRVCWADDNSVFWQQWYWTDVPFIAPAVRHQRHLAVTVERGIPFLLFTCLSSVNPYPILFIYFFLFIRRNFALRNCRFLPFFSWNTCI